VGVLHRYGRPRPGADLRQLLRRRPRARHPAGRRECADLAELFTAAGLDATEVDLGTEQRAAEIGSGGARIAFYGEKNWWSRGDSIDATPVGDPGGPDSEVFYLYPDVPHDPAFGARCHPNCDCGRYLEIGNSVFMEYLRTPDGFAPLPRRNVDFGGGLERIAAAAIDSPDVYRISLLRPIVDRLAELAGTGYEQRRYGLRVVADHLRGAAFLVADGVRPANKEQGYVLRRLIRRAVRVAHSIGLTEDFLAEVVPTVTELYRDSYPEVAANAGRRSPCSPARSSGSGGRWRADCGSSSRTGCSPATTCSPCTTAPGSRSS
jgi:alanyl-tRNA synthetase